MSIINLGLQALALARAKMPDEMEALAKNCNSLKALLKVAQGKPQFRDACLDALAPVKVLLNDVVCRLELKEKNFEVFTAATENELNEFWTSLSAFDEEFHLGHDDKVNATNFNPDVKEFLSLLQREALFQFDILKYKYIFKQPIRHYRLICLAMNIVTVLSQMFEKQYMHLVSFQLVSEWQF